MKSEAGRMRGRGRGRGGGREEEGEGEREGEGEGGEREREKKREREREGKGEGGREKEGGEGYDHKCFAPFRLPRAPPSNSLGPASNLLTSQPALPVASKQRGSRERPMQQKTRSE